LELPPQVAENSVPWYYEPVFVLLSIFLVFAVFGLPLLWKSPRFSRSQKVIVSIITFVYTGATICLFCYLVFYLLLPRYRELMSVL
jgi:hypothetical protein